VCGTLTGNSTGPLCKDIPLTGPLVAALLTNGLTSSAVSPNQGLTSLTLSGWGDSKLTQENGQPIPNTGIYQAQTLEPSAENTALMSLLDSDQNAKELLDNALNNPGSNALTKSDTPSETWPFHGIHGFVGGDAGLIGKELSINAETNAPAEIETWGGLGGTSTGSAAGPDDVFPVASVWTGAPQGTPWNLPTAAIQNAALKFVPPTEAAAAEAEADASMDPTTNLVTFAANPNDKTAYNNYLMVESYLVVPTSGLSPTKAAKLAQYIRFVVGPVAQSDETTLGAAPPTPTMVAADLKVATQLDNEAGTSSSANATGSSGSSTTTTTSTSTTVAASSNATPGSTSAGATGNTGAGAATSPSLASTGAPNIVPLLGAGGALVALGALGRRRMRRLRRPEARS